MIAALNTFRRGARAHAAPATRVRVRGGYSPNVVFGRVGEPLRIVFRREETAACSEQVVFPDFGMSAMLPPHQDVTVELHPDRAGEYEFTCQMGMLHGRLVVEPARLAPAPAGAKKERTKFTAPSRRRPGGGVLTGS